jgi:hypothetical protein
MTVDEQYLADALRDGIAVKRELSMDALGVPDVSLQARVVHLDEAHVERLRESLREMGALRPVVVFRCEGNGRLWVADGFHRHEAYRREKLTAIPAYLVEGGHREALKFSTMCNRTCCLARSMDDMRKAAEMLFADEEWSRKSDSLIGEHIGISHTSINRWRSDFYLKTGRKPPEAMVTKQGRVCGRKKVHDAARDRMEKRISHRPRVPKPMEFDRSRYLPHGRAIIICESPPALKPWNVARQLGVVFMTPEEVIEALKETHPC